MRNGELRQRLVDLGYLETLDADPQAVLAALCDLQRLHGLTVDAEVGPITRRVLEAPRFCGHPDVMAIGSDLSRWPDDMTVSWGIDGVLPGISADEFQSVAVDAFAAWSAVCGLQFRYMTNARGANILITTGRIDRGGGTLAWSELPYDAREGSQLKQKYDTAENFRPTRPARQWEIWLLPVMTHEIGHAIGIGHLEAGNLLQPTYDPSVWEPQAGDIREAQRRYGQPAEQPDPPPTDDGKPQTLQISIETPAGIVPRVEIPGFRVVPMV